MKFVPANDNILRHCEGGTKKQSKFNKRDRFVPRDDAKNKIYRKENLALNCIFQKRLRPMNRLTGNITGIQSHEGISLVKVKMENDSVFTSIVLDTADTADYLKPGNAVNVIFKETEVVISKDLSPNISIQNRSECIVQSVKEGALLSQVNLAFAGTTIKAIITSNACQQLGIKENDKVLVLIKTNEVSLSPHD